MPKQPPAEVSKIRKAITDFFKTVDPKTGRRIGTAQCGVYAFYDYDDEPIYVGQTIEGLSGRVSRHLTGRRRWRRQVPARSRRWSRGRGASDRSPSSGLRTWSR